MSITYQIKPKVKQEDGSLITLDIINSAGSTIVGEVDVGEEIKIPASNPDESLETTISIIKKYLDNLSSISIIKRDVSSSLESPSEIDLATSKAIYDLNEIIKTAKASISECEKNIEAHSDLFTLQNTKNMSIDADINSINESIKIDQTKILENTKNLAIYLERLLVVESSISDHATQLLSIGNSISDLNITTGDLKDLTSGHSTTILEHTNQLGSIALTLVNHLRSIDANATAISNNLKLINTNTTAINQNKTNISENAETIKSLVTTTETQSISIAENSSSIDTLKSESIELEKRVSTTETNIKSDSKRIEVVEQKSDSNGESIELQATAIKQNTDKLKTLQTTTSDNVSRLDLDETSIGLLKESTNAHETRLDNLESTTEKNTTAISGKAPKSHASDSLSYGGGTDTSYGHIMLVDTYDVDVSKTGGALKSKGASDLALFNAYAALNTRITSNTTAISGKAPTNHASTGTGYGAGTSSKYGHVKLSDTYQSSVSGASADGSIGSSQNALYNAYHALDTRITSNTTAISGKAPKSHASDSLSYGGATESLYGHVMLVDTYNTNVTETGGALKSKGASDLALFNAYTALTSAIGGKLANSHACETATASKFSHVKLSDNYTSSAGAASGGIGASSAAVYSAYSALNTRITSNTTAISGKAPTNHASTGTGYGVGTSANFGHLKISDNYTSSAGAVADGVAASSFAVNATYKALTTHKSSADHDSRYYTKTQVSTLLSGGSGMVGLPIFLQDEKPTYTKPFIWFDITSSRTPIKLLSKSLKNPWNTHIYWAPGVFLFLFP